jgi:signal transduction histidine kinase
LFNHQGHSTVRDYLIGDWWFAHDLFHLLSGVAYMYAVVIFPDGRLVPVESRHRWLLRLGYGLATLVLAGMVLDGTSVGHPGQPFFTVLFGLLIPLAGVAAQTYRLRRATDPVVRQQSRLLRWALLPMLVVGAVYLVLTRALDTTVVEDIGLAVFPALFALIPLALVMGILRYRLWDIDILVSRALLSVGLAAFIGSVYVVVVVWLGHGLGPSGSAGVKIIATAIAAFAFEPVRERLARFANRLVYGERATPYELMAEFSDRLGDAISVDEVLPRIAEAAVKAVGGIAGRVTAFLPGGGNRTVEWPAAETVQSFSYVRPVTYRGEEVGEIAVATPHGERLRPAEDALLTALAAQAGLAVNNARLTMELQARLQEISVQAAELRASRQRIVTARQVQRQRVVQLIQERVETRLRQASSLLDELEPLLASDAERAAEHADVLLDECRDALDALRDLARGIFPAILADQGVMVAIDAYILQARLPVDIHVDGPDASDRYDPQAEAIVYFCVIQALENAGTYASGCNVLVRLRADFGNLVFSVSDDGPGVDPSRLRGGADIRDMGDRVEAIGGALDATGALGEGTSVSGWVPATT